jgi:4-hydroxy-3-methylbut-2-en-1-yl diphosphate synthase IspG/GcpE
MPDYNDQSARRFDRIEQKLDKLTEAITGIIRIEEQLANNNRSLIKLEDRVTKLENDLRLVADIARNNATVARFLDKLFWVLATAGVGLFVWVIQYWIGA